MGYVLQTLLGLSLTAAPLSQAKTIGQMDGSVLSKSVVLVRIYTLPPQPYSPRRFSSNTAPKDYAKSTLKHSNQATFFNDCTGTILTLETILLADHCVSPGVEDAESHELFYQQVLGVTLLGVNAEHKAQQNIGFSEPTLIGPDRINRFTHDENPDSTVFGHDLALIFLPKKLDSTRFKPITLFSGKLSDQTLDQAFIGGFGGPKKKPSPP